MVTLSALEPNPAPLCSALSRSALCLPPPAQPFVPPPSCSRPVCAQSFPPRSASEHRLPLNQPCISGFPPDAFHTPDPPRDNVRSATRQKRTLKFSISIDRTGIVVSTPKWNQDHLAAFNVKLHAAVVPLW